MSWFSELLKWLISLFKQPQPVPMLKLETSKLEDRIRKTATYLMSTRFRDGHFNTALTETQDNIYRQTGEALNILKIACKIGVDTSARAHRGCEWLWHEIDEWYGDTRDIKICGHCLHALQDWHQNIDGKLLGMTRDGAPIWRCKTHNYRTYIAMLCLRTDNTELIKRGTSIWNEVLATQKENGLFPRSWVEDVNLHYTELILAQLGNCYEKLDREKVKTAFKRFCDNIKITSPTQEEIGYLIVIYYTCWKLTEDKKYFDQAQYWVNKLGENGVFKQSIRFLLPIF